MRLVQPTASPHTHTKLSRAIDRIYSVWDETKQQHPRSCFLRSIDAHPDRFNVYDEIRRNYRAWHT